MASVDLLTATFDDGELAKKYNNYMAPSAKVLIGASKADLTTACSAQIESVQVSLNVRDAASASITITNIYDQKNRCIDSGVKNTLCLGESVIVELGYGSDRQDVFHGFIYERSMELGDMPTMRITALEVRRLMSENYRNQEHLTGADEVKVFNNIMTKYQKLSMKIETDAPVLTFTEPFIQTDSDLNIVRRLCKKSDKCFLVCGGKVYFTKKKEPASIASLTWGLDILSFSQNISYVDTKIEVRGNIKNKPETKYVETRTVTSGGNIKKVLQESIQKIITLTDVSSVDDLAARADNEEESLEERVSTGSGTCIGLPVLIPGRYIKIAGIDADINGEYYLQSVNHSFGGDGYTTSFTVGGKRGK